MVHYLLHVLWCRHTVSAYLRREFLQNFAICRTRMSSSLLNVNPRDLESSGRGRDKEKKKPGIKIRRELSLCPLIKYNMRLVVLNKIEGWQSQVLFRAYTEYISCLVSRCRQCCLFWFYWSRLHLIYLVYILMLNAVLDFH